MEKSLNLIVDGPLNHVVVGDCWMMWSLLAIVSIFVLPWLLFLNFFYQFAFFFKFFTFFFLLWLNSFLKINIKENKNKSIVRQEMGNLRKLALYNSFILHVYLKILLLDTCYGSRWKTCWSLLADGFCRAWKFLALFGFNASLMGCWFSFGIWCYKRCCQLRLCGGTDLLGCCDGCNGVEKMNWFLTPSVFFFSVSLWWVVWWLSC